MLALSDDQLAAVMTAADKLPRRSAAYFLNAWSLGLVCIRASLLPSLPTRCT